MNGNIFQYLEKTKGKPLPLEYKLINNLPLTEDDLIYNGDLLLISSYITHLPNNLTVNGRLSLYNSKIKVLPNNLTINGGLNINSTKISTLPNNLYVNSILDINRTNISDLPDNLYVGSELSCINTPLAERIKNDVSLLTKYKKQVKGDIFYDWNLPIPARY